MWCVHVTRILIPTYNNSYNEPSIQADDVQVEVAIGFETYIHPFCTHVVSGLTPYRTALDHLRVSALNLKLFRFCTHIGLALNLHCAGWEPYVVPSLNRISYRLWTLYCIVFDLSIVSVLNPLWYRFWIHTVSALNPKLYLNWTVCCIAFEAILYRLWTDIASALNRHDPERNEAALREICEWQALRGQKKQEPTLAEESGPS